MNDSTQTEKDMGNGWKQVIRREFGLVPRSGWRLRWDHFLSALTGRPLYLVPGIITASVYVKTDKPFKLELHGLQLEQGPRQ